MKIFKEPIHKLENPTTFDDTNPRRDTSSHTAEEQKNIKL